MMKTEMKLKKKVKVVNKMMKWMHSKVLDHQETELVLVVEQHHMMLK
jgi:hypothetical protein